MSSLVNKKIKNTYDGLIKTSDELPIDGTLKNLEDGNGGVLPMQVSTGGVNFTGTVTGLPAAVQGLESGTGASSLQSNGSLTTTPADASGTNSIAIGNNAEASAEGAVAIGEDTIADGDDCVAIGRGANSNSESIAIGDGTTNAAGRSVAIGRSAACAGNSVAVGNFAQSTGSTTISMSCASIAGMQNSADDSIMIVPGDSGGRSNAAADGCIVLGAGGSVDRATINAINGVAIGKDAITDASGAVALGEGVTASTADTVSVKALETQTDGGVNIKGDGTNAGKLKLYCEDAAGTHNVTLEGPAHAGGATYSLKFPNIQSTGSQILEADASGNLAWINTPGGGGGSAGLVSGTGTDSMQSASSLTTVGATASAADTIALGDSATATSSNNIAIGNTANAGGDDSFARNNIAIGVNTDATNEKDVAIGNAAQATGSRSTAIGDSANVSGGRAVVVGASSSATAFSSCVFGAFSTATAEGATVVGGYGSSATAVDAIAVGKEADATAIGAIAIGKLAQATADGAVAIGSGINAVTADTVTMDKLQILDYANINYLDDTAAAAGGIPLGGVYHYNGALKIRIV